METVIIDFVLGHFCPLFLVRVLRHLHTLSPSTVRVATLLDKPSRRVVSVPVDYCGFEIDDHFVVGFGMDVDQRYRSLRFIGVVDDDTEV